ncbi:MAG: glutamate transport system substrate-binding protein, partial [Streptomyces sp.]|nr:glutamate transport system substrate-binding protein [Streptomyces sp.]
MRARCLPVLTITTVLALGLGACGSDEESASNPTPQPEEKTFPAGTKMAELAGQGSIKIGVKKDQPGIGFEEPGASEPTGLDIEIAKVLAAK